MAFASQMSGKHLVEQKPTMRLAKDAVLEILCRNCTEFARRTAGQHTNPGSAPLPFNQPAALPPPPPPPRPQGEPTKPCSRVNSLPVQVRTAPSHPHDTTLSPTSVRELSGAAFSRNRRQRFSTLFYWKFSPSSETDTLLAVHHSSD